MSVQQSPGGSESLHKRSSDQALRKISIGSHMRDSQEKLNHSQPPAPDSKPVDKPAPSNVSSGSVSAPNLTTTPSPNPQGMLVRGGVICYFLFLLLNLVCSFLSA
jgi:hypothetical protein